jgi:hypothetical protein
MKKKRQRQRKKNKSQFRRLEASPMMPKQRPKKQLEIKNSKNFNAFSNKKKPTKKPKDNKN